MTSAASAGGAAGAGGVGLQNRVFAWAAAAMAAERPLLGLHIEGTVVRVGAQTGFVMDDVAAETDARCFALFQVKAGLGLGETADSPLAGALKQAVEQYANGRLPVGNGPGRPVDVDRDALVLCTDRSAPATVRDDLRTALSRTGSQPPGTLLGHELTVNQRKALEIVVAHARPMWKAATGSVADDEDLRQLFRALRVITVDAYDGEPDHAAAVATLAVGLTPADADAAWPVLVEHGQAASAARDWRDRASIGVALSRRGVHLTPPSRYAHDIETLRELSTVNLTAFAADALLPVPGGLRIARQAAAVLVSGAGDGNVLVVGDAGAGKSAVAQGFAAARTANQQVVALRASDVAGANKVPLDDPLAVVLRSWTGPPALLMIDGVDALRGPEDRQFLSDVVSGLRGSRWQVVATARTFDARNNHDLQAAFAGTPLSADPSGRDPRLYGVRHLLVGDLTDDEIDAAVVAPLALASLLEKASPELRALLRNPFNLRLAAVLAQTLTAGQQDELLAVRSRVGLLEAYWDRRVRAEDRTAREALLARLCAHMAAERSLRALEAEPLVTAADSAAVRALLSENVLAVDAGLVPTGRQVLEFSHNILFDYAVALYVLLDPIDPSRLLEALDADPSLPMVARPSFDLLVDLLWEHREAGAFWPLCLEVAGSTHVLASLAFAARLLQLVRAADDLLALAPETGRAVTGGGLSPAQAFTAHLVGALRAAALLPEPAGAAPALAALARRFAGNAAVSYSDGALAVDLLTALHLRMPLEAGLPGADDRAEAIAALLDACRSDPQRMERLAGAVARLLPHAVAASASVRGAVGRLLGDDAAMRQWGGTVLTWLADAVFGLVAEDSDLARRTARVVATFEDAREEHVTFGGGALMPLNESRTQQARHGAFRLGRSFGQICEADLVTAAEMFCDLAEDESPSEPDGPWPVTVPGASGSLRCGRDLSIIGHGAEEAAAAALGAALGAAQAAGGDTMPAVAVLARRLRNAAAWAALMSSPRDASALGRTLLDAFGSGALLAHPDTHAAAAGLLAAVADAAGDDQVLTARLEQAVLRAHALVDANNGPQRTKDALLGCLGQNAVASPDLASRLEELGPEGPPAPLPRMRVTATTEQWTIVDRLASEGVVLSAEVEAAARTLYEEVMFARNGRDDRPDEQRRLPEAFAEADRAFSECTILDPSLALLLVEAAADLARDRRVKPGTSVGDRVLAVLAQAAGSAAAGKLSM
jgi:hypothetical protein